MKPRKLVTAVLVGGLAFPAFALAADNPMDKSGSRADPARSGDNVRMKERSQEKEQLQKALRPGQERSFYRQELERLGYKITAVNREDADSLEYEVVKGANSYEVQVEFDKTTKKATDVDVSTNIWKAEQTDRALEKAQPKN